MGSVAELLRANAQGIDQLERRVEVCTLLDAEASAFVHVLAREEDVSEDAAALLVVQAGLRALGCTA